MSNCDTLKQQLLTAQAAYRDATDRWNSACQTVSLDQAQISQADPNHPPFPLSLASIQARIAQLSAIMPPNMVLIGLYVQTYQDIQSREQAASAMALANGTVQEITITMQQQGCQ